MATWRNCPKLRWRSRSRRPPRHQIAAPGTILARTTTSLPCSLYSQLGEVSPPHGGDNLEPERLIGGPLSYEGVETVTRRKSYARLIRSPRGRTHSLYFQLFRTPDKPTLLVTNTPPTPHPRRTAVECEWLFSREAVEQETRPSDATAFGRQQPSDGHVRAVSGAYLRVEFVAGLSHPRGRRYQSSQWSKKATSRQGFPPREPRPRRRQVSGLRFQDDSMNKPASAGRSVGRVP